MTRFAWRDISHPPALSATAAGTASSRALQLMDTIIRTEAGISRKLQLMDTIIRTEAGISRK